MAEQPMKVLVVSDVHGRVTPLRWLLKNETADALFFLGDGLYDLDQAIAANGAAPDYPIYRVRGNCDTEVDQMVLDFPILADYALLYAGSRTVFATHGHHYNTACLPPLAKGDILLHGHTHVPVWQEFGSGNLYLNPGSVAIPKENSAHSYMMLTDSGFAWKDLEGSIYHTLALDCPNCG